MKCLNYNAFEQIQPWSFVGQEFCWTRGCISTWSVLQTEWVRLHLLWSPHPLLNSGGQVRRPAWLINSSIFVEVDGKVQTVTFPCWVSLHRLFSPLSYSMLNVICNYLLVMNNYRNLVDQVIVLAFLVGNWWMPPEMASVETYIWHLFGVP